MKLFRHLLVMFALLSFTGGAFAQTNTNSVRIYYAVEVEFHAETNNYYKLQSSSNLIEWHDVTEPVFGNAAAVSHLRSTRGSNNSSGEFFRLVTLPATNVSFAPAGFAGVTLSLNDSVLNDLLQFTNATGGVLVDGGVSNLFIYTYTKTGESEARVDLVRGTTAYYADRSNVYHFTFAAPTVGTFTSEEYRLGRLKSRRMGTFQVTEGIAALPGTTNGLPQGTNAIPTNPPVSLAGLVYFFQSGSTPDRLDFSAATNGYGFEDNLKPSETNGAPDAFAYSYTLTAPSNATLIVMFSPTKRDEYTLTFTAGAQGTFIRREYRNNILDDTDTGSFTPSSLTPYGTGGNSGGGGGGLSNTPPASVNGTTYTMSDDSPPAKALQFISATAGTQTSTNVDSFIYTYSVTGVSTSALTVQFKPDRWDEYDLTFTGNISGNFVRRVFKSSTLNDTKSGTFLRTAP
ncbi:MAG: hypothetical protein HY301_14740 [Verrucomicrobia bacterium]|nr:hypothetical protein [Verrucomicrobiota bacterium]